MSLSERLQQRPAGPLLGGLDEAAWVIDATHGIILEATPTGAKRFGLTAIDRLAVDRAMPAIAKLADLAGRLAVGEEVRLPLVLWTPRGALRVPCSVRRLADLDGALRFVVVEQAAVPRALEPEAVNQPSPGDAARRVRPVVVPAEPAVVDVVRRSSAPDVAGPAARTDGDRPLAAGAPASTPNDNDTLIEIARRIRAGLNGPRPLASAPDAAAADAAPATAAQIDEPRGPVMDVGPHEPEPAAPRQKGLQRLAHELRTPLSVIASMAEIMRDERFGALGNDRYRAYAGDMFDSAQHALSVLQAILERDAEGLPAERLEITVIDLNALLERSASAMRPLMERAGIDLRQRLAPRLPNVIADQRTLRQIVLNLLANAIKATPAGGAITIASQHELDGRVRLEIADTGRGLAQADVLRILGGLDVAGDGPREEGQRSGLGLPLVRELAEANGGELAIDSQPGRGSRFSILFARERVARERATPATLPPVPT